MLYAVCTLYPHESFEKSKSGIIYVDHIQNITRNVEKFKLYIYILNFSDRDFVNKAGLQQKNQNIFVFRFKSIVDPLQSRGVCLSVRDNLPACPAGAAGTFWDVLQSLQYLKSSSGLSYHMGEMGGRR